MTYRSRTFRHHNHYRSSPRLSAIDVTSFMILELLFKISRDIQNNSRRFQIGHRWNPLPRTSTLVHSLGFHLRARIRHGRQLLVGDSQQWQTLEGYQAQVLREGGVKMVNY